MGSQSKYREVIRWVKENIADGTLRYGDRMPSENELSERFGLSRQTIRHATGELVNEGVITRVQGSGTYIGGNYAPARKERYMNIAVVSTFYESYIFPPILKGIEKELSRKGYTMQVSFTDNRVTNEEKILRGLLEKDNIDGLIIEPSKGALPNPNIRYYKELMERHVPILFFNAAYRELNLPCVRIDDRDTFRQATEVLIEAGHRQIGAILKLDDMQGHLRYAGFTDAILKAGIHYDPSHIVWQDTEAVNHPEKMADYLFQRLAGCTAVVCYNDQVAMDFINLAYQRGIRVPEDISVVGVDDSNLASICRVPFTSFPHPKMALGVKAADNMMKMIDNPDFDGNFIFRTEPVRRESVMRLEI
ncbi:MAG: GntR family transcriptional regulator [Eubacteriales bacterium]|jgi:GntR family transcriptional regulator of arabinose operon